MHQLELLANLKAVIFSFRLHPWVGIVPGESTNGTSTSGLLSIHTEKRPRGAGRSRHTGGKLSVCGDCPPFSRVSAKVRPWDEVGGYQLVVAAADSKKSPTRRTGVGLTGTRSWRRPKCPSLGEWVSTAAVGALPQLQTGNWLSAAVWGDLRNEALSVNFFFKVSRFIAQSHLCKLETQRHTKSQIKTVPLGSCISGPAEGGVWEVDG